MLEDIPNIYEIRKGVELTEAINKLWWGNGLAKNGKLKYHPFVFIQNCYVPGYILRLYYAACDRNWFAESVNMEQACNEYSIGFIKGYKDFEIEANGKFGSEETVFNAIINFPYGERPVPDKWNNYGERVGRLYCAWCIVIKHQNTFEPMFNKLVHNSDVHNEITFDSLFKVRANSQEVRKILEIKGYTNRDKWVGLSHNKTELLLAYYTLVPILNPGKPTPQAKVFYKEFGLQVPGYISSRSLTTDPRNGDNAEEFEIIFAPLLVKTK